MRTSPAAPGWLAEVGVIGVTPNPPCTLTETHYNVRRHRIEYDAPVITEFTRHFGRAEFGIAVHPEKRDIVEIAVTRDAVCRCARSVAQELLGVPVDEAEHLAGLLHHRFLCLAGMGKDTDFDDTIMHVPGNLMKKQIREQVDACKETRYIVPRKKRE